MEESVTEKDTANTGPETLAALGEAFAKRLDTKDLDLRTYSPLTLAFIGDGIYDLLIRTMVVAKANTSNHALHQKTANLVKAETQSAMMEGLLPLLTEEEKKVYMRGRNAKSATMAKNATVSDYRRATGLEALFGSLYLKGNYKRLLQLVAAGLSFLETDHE